MKWIVRLCRYYDILINVGKCTSAESCNRSLITEEGELQPWIVVSYDVGSRKFITRVIPNRWGKLCMYLSGLRPMPLKVRLVNFVLFSVQLASCLKDVP